MALFFSIVISSIGLAYFIYGKKNYDVLYMIVGVGLMIYPYFIWNLLFSVIIGSMLCALPLVLKRFGIY